MADFSSRGRKGSSVAQWVMAGLLGVIACALVVIIILLVQEPNPGPSPSPPPPSAVKAEETAKQKDLPKPSPPPPPAVKAEETAKREEVPKPPPPPPEIGKPERIRDVLLEGRTYAVTSSFTLNGPVRDKDWGMEKIVHLNYLAEVQFTRRIDKNDGRRIEEFRHIKQCRMLKAESTAQFRFVWTEPGILLLGGLDWLITGGAVVLELLPIQKIIDTAYQYAVNEANTKVKGMIDGMEGKQFRVVYEDGQGVLELTPAGCDLTEEERDFLMTLSVVSDAYILPDKESKPGQTWEVPAEALSDFLPPEWRGRPEGKVIIRRVKDFEQGGHGFARLEIQSGTFQVIATDQSWERIASFTPRGWFEYDITEGHVAQGELRGTANMHKASRDHLLFEARFEASPQGRSTYSCRLLPEEVKRP